MIGLEKRHFELLIPVFVRTCRLALTCCSFFLAAIAQLGERQTEDLKVPGSIPGRGTLSFRAYGTKVRVEIR